MRKSDSVAASAPQRLAVIYRPTGDLRPYERNARTHPPEQLAQIRASIRRFGFNNPILLRDDDATIGAGHGRWEAAQAEGLAEIPTITLHGLTETQWRAYVIADNKIALNGGWDEDTLALELEAILADMPDLAEAIGFDQAELDALLSEAEEAGRQTSTPDFNYREQFGVIVVCPDEPAQKAAFEALSASGYDCRVVVT